MINIIAKTEELKKIQTWKAEKVKKASVSQREKLLKRHKKIIELEENSSIFKTRELKSTEKKKIFVSDFGFGKIYDFQKAFENLSTPKEVDEFLYTKSDLRGAVNASPFTRLTPIDSNDGSANRFLITELRTRRRRSME